METITPVTLGKSPLLEAIFEVRFEPSIPAAGDLLPGVLFTKLRGDFSSVEPLPISNVPRGIRDQDPSLVFQPSHRLSGSNKVVQVGDRVLSVSTQTYPGWSAFKATAENLLNHANETDFIQHVLRYSFRYINLVPKAEDSPEMSLLNVDLTISGIPPLERGLQMRFEQDEEDFTTIVQIALQSIMQHPVNPSVAGVLVDVDTHMINPSPDFFANMSELLDPCHDKVKNTFFSLISQKALSDMLPTY